MTILRALAALAQTDETLRQGINLTRRKIAALVAATFAAAAVTLTAVLWLSVALFLWLTPDLGQIGAALVTGLVFVVIVAIGILVAGGQFEAGAGSSERPPGNDLVALLQDGVRKESERAPKPMWDLAAMLAVGVVSGLSDRKRG